MSEIDINFPSHLGLPEGYKVIWSEQIEHYIALGPDGYCSEIYSDRWSARRAAREHAKATGKLFKTPRKRDWCKENPEKYRECLRRHYSNNRAKCLEASTKWNVENRAKCVEAGRRHREANWGKIKESIRQHKLANPEKFREYRRKWRAANPEKRSAHQAVARAIKEGSLIRKVCERCGAERTEAHHDDYTKPLDVRWLCRKHHAEIHRIYK